MEHVFGCLSRRVRERGSLSAQRVLGEMQFVGSPLGFDHQNRTFSLTVQKKPQFVFFCEARFALHRTEPHPILVAVMSF